jgi:hypothetical protein
MRQHVLKASVGASTLMGTAYAALAVASGLGPSEAFSTFAVAGTLTLFLALI